ncbi:MAG TPA: rRNA adenine N-6-methyltransferase family protein [Rhizomicrobium sp.]|nr:rRNA adenine N-6-methyltransferase family protein [Rhizomicrobium sp.]
MSATTTNDWQFLRGFLARPLAVASPVPSGRALARTIAAQIAPTPGGLVLELGPGTGAVTRAILEQGVARADLVAIESDPQFADLLREQFTGVAVIQGDAFDFARLLRARGTGEPLRSIVSGVPVLSQPVEIRHRLLRDAVAALRPGGPFIQFSYGMRPPIPPVDGIAVRRAAIVWRNLPPMHVWVYCAR